MLPHATACALTMIARCRLKGLAQVEENRTEERGECNSVEVLWEQAQRWYVATLRWLIVVQWVGAAPMHRG